MTLPFLRPASSGIASLVLAGCVSAPGAVPVISPGQPEASGDPVALEVGPGDGLLVMAHGGSPEWNHSVAQAVDPLRQQLPTALAFGMADPSTLQAGLDSLATRGVSRVAVVRLFMSGASFLHQTEYLLGLREDPPAESTLHHGGGSGGMADEGDGGHHELRPLRHEGSVVLGLEGLGASPLAGAILVDRAVSRSLDPASERVFLLAHGMGDEADNDRVLGQMAAPAAELRARGFQAVEVATLREDWPEARVNAEAHIRSWVAAGQAAGARTIVVPYRLSGFGPYAEVLDGLVYEPTEGLLPHPLITRWIQEQAAALLCAPDDGRGVGCGRMAGRS